MSTPVQHDPLVLASKSPRRADLLRQAGYRFEIADPTLSEPSWIHPGIAPPMHAESLAYFKACSVADDHRQATILAADTIVVLDDQIIGKPTNREDARAILQRLSGTTHSVITGVVLLHPASGRRMLQYNSSTVSVRTIKDDWIDPYLDSGKWQGKAGAYGIQDQDDPLVEKMTGSFTNIVGLPMELLARMLEHWRQEGSS